MKVYKTTSENIIWIRQIFGGYIFRRVEGDIGYVSCSIKQKERIERHGIELILVEV